MRRAVILAAAAASAAFAVAAPAQQTDQQKIRQIIVYGTDPCPPSTGDEITVCARRPETERYRIPEPLREPAAPTPQNESWAERAEALERVGRTGIQSCSPVGPGGATGCLQQLIDQARAERRAREAEENDIP